ncbi:MerR family transcriptional regulator [Deinococcus aetherius]|uniref:MerR family transcriptional regulator n=1 Tax=Deinococcus aetherius TaxID=200252 RepID=A0ABM8ABL6_9DEIO|nr:MerR family transcriptional regulator [Deinococcus aetherius]BDP41147.1 MerR family transcriptional regulator [Deinococcus aetherius]
MRVKIGELSRQTGLSVRTLRHYDALGLLTPGERTTGAHRLYSREDAERLWQIQALKSLGLSLEAIRRVLGDPGHDPAELLRRHIEHVEARVREEQAYLARLRRLERAGQPTWSDLMEVIRMNEESRKKVDRMLETAREVGGEGSQNFDEGQMAYLRERAEAVGQTRIEEVQREWPELMTEVLTELERGTPPSDPRVKALAERWHALVREFTGGRQDIGEGLNRGYERRMTPEMQAMWDYIRAASR